MKKTLLAAGALVLLAPFATAAAEEDFSLVLIAEPQGVNKYVDVALEGLEGVRLEHGLTEEQVTYVETINQGAAMGNVQEAIGQYEYISLIGNISEHVVETFAQEFPEQKFLLIDGHVEADNVISVDFKDYEAAFLAGLAAGNETEADKIGFVASWDEEVAAEFETAFRTGVQIANEDAEIIVHSVENVDDIEGARQATHEMFEQGVDVIYTAASRPNKGVFEAGQEIKREDPNHLFWIIGSDVDQIDEGIYVKENGDEGNFALTSTIKRYNRTIECFVGRLAADEEIEAGIHELGIYEEQVDILKGQLEDDTYDLVDEYRSQILDGELEVQDLIDEANL